MKSRIALEKGLDFQGFFSVVPAHAGVIPTIDKPEDERMGSPRTCGGDPGGTE